MTRRDWRDFYLVQDDLKRWTEADVDVAEATPGVQLPDGYGELVTTLGKGVISGSFGCSRRQSWRTGNGSSGS
jgi:hypothetical protein